MRSNIVEKESEWIRCDTNLALWIPADRLRVYYDWSVTITLVAKPSYCHLLVPPVIYHVILCKRLYWFNLDTFTRSENVTKIKTTSYKVFKGTLETQTKCYFIHIHVWCIKGNLLPPANEVCGGNVFIPVILFTGWLVSQHASQVTWPEGFASRKGLHLGGRVYIQDEGLHPGGVCIQWGWLGRPSPTPDTKGSTHHTGMHSYFVFCTYLSSKWGGEVSGLRDDTLRLCAIYTALSWRSWWRCGWRMGVRDNRFLSNHLVCYLHCSSSFLREDLRELLDVLVNISPGAQWKPTMFQWREMWHFSNLVN